MKKLHVSSFYYEKDDFYHVYTYVNDIYLLVFSSVRQKSDTGTTNTIKGRLFDGSQLVNKTWGAVKIAGSTIKSTTQQAAALATNQIRSKRAAKDQRKIEKQISDEIHKIFDDSDSFYYCPSADFTNNLQRKDAQECDDRFFWNKYMLKDILALDVSDDKSFYFEIHFNTFLVFSCSI